MLKVMLILSLFLLSACAPETGSEGSEFISEEEKLPENNIVDFSGFDGVWDYDSHECSFTNRGINLVEGDYTHHYFKKAIISTFENFYVFCVHSVNNINGRVLPDSCRTDMTARWVGISRAYDVTRNEIGQMVISTGDKNTKHNCRFTFNYKGTYR